MSELMLSGALTRLREILSTVRLPLSLPAAEEGRQEARQIVAQLDDYVLPRLANIEAPLLAVVGGSTGAGKSTLVNSMIGRVVTTPGVIRPTTKAPVLIFNPGDEHWFTDSRILPGMIRSRVSSQDQRTLQLVPEPTLPPGLAILDAPDIDSVVEANRLLASQLLDAADLWMFTTSAARYADAVPWDFLSKAADRGASVAVVCNRVPPAAMQVVPPDLGRMMSARGLAESPLFAVPETVVDEEGMLPDSAVAPLRTYLATLAADKESRQNVILATLDGAIGSLIARTPKVARAINEHVDVIDGLYEDASKSFAEASRAVSVQSADGTLLKGEVLARWHDYVGAGDLMRQLDQGVGRMRDRIGRALKGNSAQPDSVTVAAQSGLETMIIEEGAAAVERAANAWDANPAGRQIIQANAGLSRRSDEFDADVARALRDWQSDVMALVENEGKGKRRNARLAAIGVNGAGAALMLVIFASTGGITGAEGGVALGASALAQRLLEAIFGDEAVRRLTVSAKSALDARVEGVMAAELARFTSVLDQLPVHREDAQDLEIAIESVNAARGQKSAGRIGGAPLAQDSVDGQNSVESGAATELDSGGQRQLEQGSHELEAGIGHDVLDAEVVADAEAVTGQEQR